MGNSVQRHLSPITLQDNGLGTRKGVWTIRVKHTYSKDGLSELLLVLRARHREQRGLILRLKEKVLCVASSRELVAAAIREWIDGSAGDGLLDLSSFAVAE